jgi:FtsP/CotA-like multicopper oxidase with cupredoxin domain
VTNGLENDEGLSLHWHGLRITNEMDGAVGIIQCLIPPGSNFTYEIIIDDDQAGTFWYHSSSSEQTAEGLYGGLVVHQPAEAKTEMDSYSYDKEILLMIGDWYHRPMVELLEDYLSHASNGAEPMPDNFLINGHGAFKCATAPLSHPVNCTDTLDDRWPQLRIQKEKRYRVRVVNVG